MSEEESENEQELNVTVKEKIEEIVGLNFFSTPDDTKKEDCSKSRRYKENKTK